MRRFQPNVPGANESIFGRKLLASLHTTTVLRGPLGFVVYPGVAARKNAAITFRISLKQMT